MIGWPPISSVLAALMPHKHNADRRHHIPKMSFKVQNWPAYEAGLRRRGSLTLWIEDSALECWQTIGSSGQGSVCGRSHSDQLDAAHGVQAGVAANRGPADVGADVNGPDNLSAKSQYDHPPDGDLAGDPAGLDTARSVARC